MLKNFDYIENLQDDIFIFAGHGKFSLYLKKYF